MSKLLSKRGKLLPFSWQSGYQWRRGKTMIRAKEKNLVNLGEVELCGRGEFVCQDLVL